MNYMEILHGYKLILTSLLVLMGISTNQQRIYFFAGYLRLAMWKMGDELVEIGDIADIATNSTNSGRDNMICITSN